MNSPIIPCLWFENQAEEAALFYTSVFKNSKITSINRYGKEGFEMHGQEEGKVMTISFQLNGKPFLGLNGGPVLNSAKQFLSWYIVIIRMKLIIIGRSLLKEERKVIADG
jgi:predicted 3-demethylubiquinone-9 3-methyltransferase (glyoxalase superfamily)